MNDQCCLVVGGGEVASRKISKLLSAGAKVTVVAPEVTASLTQLAQQSRVNLMQRLWQESDLMGVMLVIAATDDAAVNQQVASACQQKNLLVNVADNPQASNAIFPAIVDRSPVLIAITTGGSPALARWIKGQVEALIPANYSELASFCLSMRERVKDRIQSVPKRTQFWRNVIFGGVAENVLTGRSQQAEEDFDQLLSQQQNDAPVPGEVYLVGAGPGDPDLLTIAALRLLQKADVVVYDRLVTRQILDMVREGAEKIYVGKKRSDHSVEQQDINQLLVDLAQQGKRVVRLKGGDPFIFGRGGEEISKLASAGLNFKVVPGITAASGSAAYAGIPLTHRDYAHVCTFVAGSLKDRKMAIDWSSLAKPKQTLAFYMGLSSVTAIAGHLIEHGLSPETPLALVQQATTINQKVFTATLGSVDLLLEQQDIQPPTMIIVGEVVRLRDQYKWFDPKPYGEMKWSTNHHQ